MTSGKFEVLENRILTEDVYKMVLGGGKNALTQPGQFINIELDGFYLRRPFSVADWDDERIVILYKILGAGTLAMTQIQPGATLDVLSGLGNGYDTAKSGMNPLLVAGGVGLSSIYGLCKRLKNQGKNPKVFLGFNSAGDVFFLDEFKSLGVNPVVCTMDGSYGVKGVPSDFVSSQGDYSYLYACGPMAMLQSLNKVVISLGEYSLEARMGCGFGACMGCTINTKNGPKRVCREGPVFSRQELIWDV